MRDTAEVSIGQRLCMASVPEKPSMTILERAEEQERLCGFVKRCRRRIAPERASLGPYLRLPIRIGKLVTQEEVAEVVGISRVWYGMLENNRPVRVSTAVLGRIADALMMDPGERASLFRLAFPELRSTTLAEDSAALLDAIGSLRLLTRRLWAATTEAEALAVVREYAMTQLAPDLMLTLVRVGEGNWECKTIGDTENRPERFLALLREHWGPAVLDDLHGYTLLAQPGELMTLSDLEARLPDLVAKRPPALEAVGWTNVSWAMANVRSQHGLTARIMASYHAEHAFSEVERAQLSTLADLTSLALLGRA
jgi:transcriptional regulator with XRE-family HTH domain